MQTSGVLIGVRFHVTTGICLGSEAVERIVGFQHGGAVGVSLGGFKAGYGVESPSGYIPIGTLFYSIIRPLVYRIGSE